MALVLKDRVKETTSTAGTGSLTLAGAAFGFQAFSVVGDGNTTYYAIVDAATGAWEVGVGTYTTTGPTLTRDSVLESSIGGGKVDFAANIKDVFCTYPAEQAVTLNDVQTLTNKTINLSSNTLVATSAQIAAAVTDETGSGALVFANSPTFVTPALGTPSSGTVTNLTGTASININGTVGATTPASGSFTSLTDSGNLTFTGTGNRITGDFSNGTLASRVYAQTNGTNLGTSFGVIPNGTGANAAYNALANSDPTNTSFGQFRAGTDTGDVRITSGVTGTGTFLPMTFFTGGGERVRIDTSGNVGIGTSSFSQTLTVQGPTSGSSAIGIQGLDTNPIADQRLGILGFGTATSTLRARIISHTDGAWTDGSSTPTRLTFWTTPSGSTTVAERMRIDSSGNVGIGTSSPASRLHIRQDQDGTTREIIQNRSASGTPLSELAFVTSTFDLSDNRYAYIQSGGGGSQYIAFGTGNGAAPSERARIDAIGNLLLGGTSTPGARVMYIANATTVPASNPSGGGVLYVEGGALKYRGSSGTVTTIANA
jgi:hypothetical protein